MNRWFMPDRLWFDFGVEAAGRGLPVLETRISLIRPDGPYYRGRSAIVAVRDGGGRGAGGPQHLRAVVEGLAPSAFGLLRPGDVPADAGLRSTVLASLGPGQLTTRLEQAGFEVTWAGSPGEQIQAMAVYRDPTGSSTAYVYRGDATAIIASIVATRDPCAWAESAGYVLVLRGDARLSTKDVLARVTEGLDARIGGSRP